MIDRAEQEMSSIGGVEGEIWWVECAGYYPGPDEFWMDTVGVSWGVGWWILGLGRRFRILSDRLR